MFGLCLTDPTFFKVSNNCVTTSVGFNQFLWTFQSSETDNFRDNLLQCKRNSLLQLGREKDLSQYVNYKLELFAKREVNMAGYWPPSFSST